MLQPILWLCFAAYGVHILEEFAFDWRSWAQNVLTLPAEWSDFYVTNSLVIVLGIAAAHIAPVWPALAMAFPALMIINAALFHVAPFVWAKGRFSPGLITALVLFVPLAIEAFRLAHLDAAGIVIAFSSGAALMATPIVFLKLKTKPYFIQTLPSPIVQPESSANIT